ncbi:hypothetical protein EH183_43410 [Streptomyces sp. CB01881]|nr:hypothetical protein EH183_43410 [Streptomyces sp. CB01881]
MRAVRRAPAVRARTPGHPDTRGRSPAPSAPHPYPRLHLHGRSGPVGAGVSDAVSGRAAGGAGGGSGCGPCRLGPGGCDGPPVTDGGPSRGERVVHTAVSAVRREGGGPAGLVAFPSESDAGMDVPWACRGTGRVRVLVVPGKSPLCDSPAG